MNAALKEYWENALAYQLNDKTLLLNRLDATNENLYGKYALIPVHNNRNVGVSARPEYGTLATAGAQGFAQAQYQLKYLYGSGQVSGPGIERTSGGLAGSVVSMLDVEMNRLMDDTRVDCSRQLYGTGDSIVTACGTSGPSTTITLSGTGFNEALQKGQLFVGMLVDVGTLANPVSLATASAITAVNLTTPSITISNSISVTPAAFVFRAGNAAASSVSYEMNGLQNTVATAANTYGTIDSTAAGNTYWDNLRINLAGNLTLDAFTQSFNRVNGISGGQVSATVTSFGIQRAFYNLLQSQVRYMDPMKLQSGFQVLEYFGTPIIADKDAPYGKIFFLDERWLRIYANRDWHWLEEDGRVLKWTPNQDSWQFVLARYMNLGASRRNTQLVLYGVTVGGAADQGI
jgi:hypothetical protein